MMLVDSRSLLRKISLVTILTIVSNSALADRIKDIADVAGVRSNQLVGYGLVAGLSGSGDGKDLRVTGQSLTSLLSGLGISVDGPVSEFDLGESLIQLAQQQAQQPLQTDNLAAVLVTAEVSPFAKPGQRLDVNVSTVGTAESLRGGNLILTELRGIDGQVYALAQGPLTVTGIAVNAAGASVEIGVPTSGRIPNGAILERLIPSSFDTAENVILNLRDADFSTANAISTVINDTYGAGVATALDSVSVAIRAPEDMSQKVAFLSDIESMEVDPGAPVARVVINSRTGTAVINRSVRVGAAAVSHGTLMVRVDAFNEVSQPNAFGDGETVEVQNADIEVTEEPSNMFVFEPGIELQEIVDAVNQVGASPSALIAILEALKRAGSLKAELVVI
ncbi:flagellar basal body P-ring protein FlgI [Gammaproteobacteria bacterium]|nr:flagellar basal body P-ring protein FlgI [Gammaproteobacteria bacterium]MDB2443617.1 flagellar basal body P-ring protein FlgI [Gammaproteobacteria bacterium]